MTSWQNVSLAVGMAAGMGLVLTLVWFRWVRRG